MKKNIIVIIAMAFTAFFQSCAQESIRPSGNIVTQEFDFTGFDKVDISNDFIAYVTFTDTEEIVIKTDDNLSDHIVVEMNGSTLEIRLKNNINIRGDETLHAFISAKMIKEFQGSGDAEIFLENELVVENLKIKLSGDSKLDGSIVAQNMTIELKGDSYMNVVGSTKELDAELRGDSKIEKYAFMVDDLDINLKGDSEAYLTVNNSIRVKASGDSYLYYRGDAVIESQSLSGDSELIKTD